MNAYGNQINIADADSSFREGERRIEATALPEERIDSSSLEFVSKLPLSELMKRASTKRIIERYSYMLTDGCGNPSCDNENCVSSGKMKPLTASEAAQFAIKLLRHRAKLCDLHASKVPRTRSPTPSPPHYFAESSSSTPDNDEAASSPFELKISIDNSIPEIVYICRNASRYSDLIRVLMDVFSKPDTLTQSFLKPGAIPPLSSLTPNDLAGLDKEKIRELEGETEKDVDSLQKSSFTWDPDETQIDFIALREAYESVFELPSHVFESCLIRALKSLADICEAELKMIPKNKLNNAEEMEKYVLSFLTVFEMPAFNTPDYVDSVLPLFCKTISRLNHSAQAYICRVWARYCRNSFKNILDQLHQLITIRTLDSSRSRQCHLQDNDDIVAATKVMKILYYANALAGQVESPVNTKDEDYDTFESSSKYNLFGDTDLRYSVYQRSIFSEDVLVAELKIDLMDCIKPYLPYSEFYNEHLSDFIEMDKDYTHYKSAIRLETQADSSSRGDTKAAADKYFSFMSHPFILSPAKKTLGLFYDNRIRMYSERRSSFVQTMAGQPPNPYLKLQVRRDHLIEDTLIRLEVISFESPQDFKKQLMVEFEGEQGMDEGGISKEFFQLITEEIFNPDYGMFTFDADTQICWFNTISFENDSQYTLIGLMLGLAIYNSIILDVRFPMVVYKKLLGKKGTFSDLEDFNPVLYNSLKCILEHEADDIEEVYMQTFRISYKDPFGSLVHHDLLPDGDKVPVKLHNKQQFVDLYADFILNKSVAKQFNAFRRGFRVVTDESPLKFLFRPEEIEILVCGSKNFDLNDLQESTRYDGGYDSSTSVIKYFWEFAHSLSHANQRKLLQFTTGSDRVPVGGLGQLHMIIARNGADSDRLPTAHTCFNVLLLPEYSTKEKLCDRMMKAINYSKGFGML